MSILIRDASWFSAETGGLEPLMVAKTTPLYTRTKRRKRRRKEKVIAPTKSLSSRLALVAAHQSLIHHFSFTPTHSPSMTTFFVGHHPGWGSWPSLSSCTDQAPSPNPWSVQPDPIPECCFHLALSDPFVCVYILFRSNTTLKNTCLSAFAVF